MNSNTIRLTMAQALIAFLDQQYVSVDGVEHKFVKGVMGIFGHGNVTGLGEALEQHQGDLHFVQGKNEQGMVHAAAAYAKQKRRLEIYACTSSIGPGALNMAAAAATATVNRIPVLLLPGDIFADRQPDPVLQQLELPSDYTISANDAFKPLSRFWDRIMRPEQLMIACEHAMRVLTDPAETGAVTLSLPQDVQCEAYDYPVSFLQKRVHYMDRRPPAPSALARAAELIRGKRRPLIIAGGGVHYAQAAEELKQFAERYQIPVTETQAGKSALPWNHPLNMGAIGVTGSRSGNLLAKNADVIIAVGTRLADFSTASRTLFANPEAEVVGLNIHPMDAGKLNGRPLIGDAKVCLNALMTELGSEARPFYEASELTVLKQQWDREVDRLYSIEVEAEKALPQTAVIGALNDFVGERDVIVCAAGSLPGDLHRLWRSSLPGTYHMEYGFSCMGYEVAGALGIKLAQPDAEVYAIVGDGSFLMLHSELLTSLQERMKINVVLLDNNGYQCIHNLQRAHGSAGFGNEFRMREMSTGALTGDFLPVDYAAYAAALGVKAYQARSLEELRAALFAARGEERSTLIEVKVEPGTNTDAYEAAWRVDTAQVSQSEAVRQAYAANCGGKHGGGMQ